MDKDFPTDDAIFWADMPGETNTRIANQMVERKLEWRRPTEVYPNLELFGRSGVIPGDVDQGQLGDCWLMAAVSGVAEYPERIESVFHNTEISRNGVYALNIYALGMPHTVIIDDLLPFMPHPKDPSIVKLAYAFLGSENALWGPLVEKALAKYTGNYWHIDGGVIYEGVSMLNGSPYEQIVH